MEACCSMFYLAHLQYSIVARYYQGSDWFTLLLLMPSCNQAMYILNKKSNFRNYALIKKSPIISENAGIFSGHMFDGVAADTLATCVGNS